MYNARILSSVLRYAGDCCGVRSGETYDATAAKDSVSVSISAIPKSTAASVSDPAGARLLCARLGSAWKTLRLLRVEGGYRGQLRGMDASA